MEFHRFVQDSEIATGDLKGSSREGAKKPRRKAINRDEGDERDEGFKPIKGKSLKDGPHAKTQRKAQSKAINRDEGDEHPRYILCDLA